MSAPQDRLPHKLPKDPYPVMSVEAFYQRYPAATVVASLQARRAPRWRSWLLVAGPVAAALLILALLVPWHLVEQAPSNSFGTTGSLRDKGRVPEVATDFAMGSSAFRLQVLQDEAFVPVQDGASLPAQSLLRFHYDNTTSDFLYLFSVDDSGAITTYYPEKQGLSVPIARGHNIPLPDGVLLDSYVGHERFFALFSDRPLATLEIEIAVASSRLRLGAESRGVVDLTQLPLDCRQATVHIVKR